MPKTGYAEWDDHEVFVHADERRLSRRAPRRKPLPKKPLPWLRLLVLSGLSVAGLVYFAQRRDRQDAAPGSRAIPTSVLVAPAPVWKPLPASPALYALDKALGTPVWEAREHTNGTREDTLTLGRFGEARYARIVLVQGSSEPARSFFVDVVRRAADAGLSVARNTQSRMVVTKFGPMETGAVTLTGPAEQNCQAFRFTDGVTGFAFQGWLCGSEARPVDDGQVACLIDGISLSGATSPSLKAVFSQAERNRLESCSPAGRTSSVSGKPQRP